MESCPSGRRCSTRNAVRVKPPRVRIPNSPPNKEHPIKGCFLFGGEWDSNGLGMNETPVGSQNQPSFARRQRRIPNAVYRRLLWDVFYCHERVRDENRTGVNDVPVARQSGPDRRASSEENRIPNSTNHLKPSLNGMVFCFGGEWDSNGDRSLPRPVGETGRRSVGNRKERRNAATMRVPRIGNE